MTKAKPAHKLRSGALTVTIWKNDGDKGPWYSVTPSRSYKQGDDWKEADSFGHDDLLPLAKLIDQAHSWIQETQQADKMSVTVWERTIISAARAPDRNKWVSVKRRALIEIHGFFAGFCLTTRPR